jgi:hypothetical protein
MALLESFVIRYLEIIPIKQFLVILIVLLLLASLVKHFVYKVHRISPFASTSRHFKIIICSRLWLIIIWLCLLCRHRLMQWLVATIFGQWLVDTILTTKHHTLLRFWWEVHHLTLLTNWQEVTVTNHWLFATCKVLVINLGGCLFLRGVPVSSEVDDILLVLSHYFLAIVEE